jgi:riboflavin kinase/FMN adenylyltransferase
MAWIVHFCENLPLKQGCVVAIGNFDGVHAGHKALLETAKRDAQACDLPLVVLTFEPHPRSVLRPDVPLQRLTTLEEKADLLAAAGVDGVAVMGFTPELAGWSPQRFMDEVLADWLMAQVVCVGENFRFGHKASGNVDLLKADKRYTTRAVSLLKDEGGVVSSSRLRGIVSI